MFRVSILCPLSSGHVMCFRGNGGVHEMFSSSQGGLLRCRSVSCHRRVGGCGGWLGASYQRLRTTNRVRVSDGGRLYLPRRGVGRLTNPSPRGVRINPPTVWMPSVRSASMFVNQIPSQASSASFRGDPRTLVLTAAMTSPPASSGHTGMLPPPRTSGPFPRKGQLNITPPRALLRGGDGVPGRVSRPARSPLRASHPPCRPSQDTDRGLSPPSAWLWRSSPWAWGCGGRAGNRPVEMQSKFDGHWLRNKATLWRCPQISPTLLVGGSSGGSGCRGRTRGLLR